MKTRTYFTVLFTLLSGLLLRPAIASAQEEVVYYDTDAIGSVRAITDHNGDEIARYDYMPFGELWPTVPPQPNERRQFAGKERDFETTGLDYFGARYHRPVSGRFTTVDPVMNIEAAVTDPQRWNRYAYAKNNPFAYIDPDGRDIMPPASFQTQAFTLQVGRHVTVSSAAVGKSLGNFFQGLNLPGHNMTPEAMRAHFFEPASDSEAALMALIDVVALAAAARGSRGGVTTVAEEIGILRDAARGRGNFSLGAATVDDANRMGRAWVGEGYKTASDGTTLVSKDGLRQYRAPSFKPRLKKTQANFEQRPLPYGAWGSNGHLDIIRK